MRLTCILNTEGFMDIEGQLPSRTRFERSHWSNRSAAPWAGESLEATIS
jgi:hypothetical protein